MTVNCFSGSDNIVADIMAKKKIQAALRQVEAMRGDAMYAERWLEGWLNGRVKEDLRWSYPHGVKGWGSHLYLSGGVTLR